MNTKPNFLRGALLHLSMNMWGGYLAPGEKRDPKQRYISDSVRCDRQVWNDVTALMQRRQYNFAVIDVGDTLIFPSHPELAIKGSWTPDEVKAELARLRGMGIEPVPKLNFSACHDGWLKEYGRMLSSPRYYQVVTDLINDVCDVFGPIRFFHLGMDEETEKMQRDQNVLICRQGDLLWHDAYFLFDLVEKRGAQPMVFATSWARSNPEAYFKKMPKSVVQNFAVYGSGYDLKRLQDTSLPETARNPYGLRQWFNTKQIADLQSFRRIGEKGYQFLSCSSNWLWKETKPGAPKSGPDRPQDPHSCAWFHAQIQKTIAPENLLGEMVAPWTALLPENQAFFEGGINQLADAMEG